jgi:hypothetical protein
VVAESIEVLGRPAVPGPRPRPRVSEVDPAELIAQALVFGYVLPDVQARGLKASDVCCARLGSLRAANGSTADGSAADGSAADGSAADGSAADGSAAPGDGELARLLADADIVNLLKSSGRLERAQVSAARRVRAAFAAVPGPFDDELVLRAAQAAGTVAGLRSMARALVAPEYADAVARHEAAIRADREAGRVPESRNALARREVASAVLAAAMARTGATRLEGRLYRLRGTLDLIGGQLRDGRVHAGPRTVPEAAQLRERVEAQLEAAAGERRERAGRLIAQLLLHLALGGPPALLPQPPDQECLDWLHKVMLDGLYSTGDDQHTLHWLGSDPYGMRTPPPPPPFMAGVDFAKLAPEHVAPLMRRLSLTREAPDAADLTPAALERDRGSLSVVERTEEQRRWGRAEGSGAPLLDPVTRIPRVLYSIWLGETPSLDSDFLDNVGYAARRYQGEIDYVLWTDIPRAAFSDQAKGALKARGERARELLEWCEANGVLLVNIYEVFHRDAPMVCQAEYVVEMSKQRPHGFASASDIVRLEVVERFGGFYADGDLRLSERYEQEELPEGGRFETLVEMIDRIAGSDIGFTMDPITKWDDAVNNDLIIAPAHHPAVRLWLEDTRANYLVPQSGIVGGLKNMARRLSGMELHAMRYLAPYRTGRIHHRVLSQLGLTGKLLPPTQPPISYWSSCSWIPINYTPKPPEPEESAELEDAETESTELEDAELEDAELESAELEDAELVQDAEDEAPATPAPAREMDEAEVVMVLKKCLTMLDWQLRARDGNLYLCGIEEVVRRLPDPDAAWTAMLIVLSFMPPSGHARAERYQSVGGTVTSVTYRRRGDDGRTHQFVDLPPEATALLQPHFSSVGWLGSSLTSAGKSIWMLDECVQPAVLRDARGAVPGSLAAAAAYAEVALDLLGRPLGVWLVPPAAPRPRTDADADAPVPTEDAADYGFTTLPEGRFGLSVADGPYWDWLQEPVVRPDTVAPLILGAGGAGRPILMSVPYGQSKAARKFAADLSELLEQPVEVIEGQLRPIGRPLPPVLVPNTRVPYRDWVARTA